MTECARKQEYVGVLITNESPRFIAQPLVPPRSRTFFAATRSVRSRVGDAPSASATALHKSTAARPRDQERSISR